MRSSSSPTTRLIASAPRRLAWRRASSTGASARSATGPTHLTSLSGILQSWPRSLYRSHADETAHRRAASIRGSHDLRKLSLPPPPEREGRSGVWCTTTHSYLPPQQRGTPVKAGPKSCQEAQVTALNAAFLERFVQQNRHGGSRGVPV